MRYEKPIVMDLGARARPVGGCVTGNSPGYPFVCKTGYGGGSDANDCLSGGAASEADSSCQYGGGAKSECGTGSAAGYAGSCTVGPSIVT